MNSTGVEMDNMNRSIKCWSNLGVANEVEVDDDSDFRTDINGSTSDESGVGRRLMRVITKPLELRGAFWFMVCYGILVQLI